MSVSHFGQKPCRILDPTGAACVKGDRVRGSAAAKVPPATRAPRAAPRYQRPIRPNRERLTPDELRDARVLEAAKVAGRRGDMAAAQEALRGTGLRVDAELSDLDGLVVRDTKGRTMVAYRGTRLTRARDVIADARIVANMQDVHFDQGTRQLRAVQSKYGQMPDRLLGFSLGGARAVALGSAHGVPTRTFNPFLGNATLLRAPGRHHVIRVTEDFATLGLPFGNNFNVTSILPRETHLNPLRAHSLANFSDDAPRRSAGITEELVHAVRDAGARAGELELLRDVHQSKNRTFSEWLHRFNGKRGGDTTPDGSALAGKRVHGDSKMVRFWRESGRTFTEAEAAHIGAVAAQGSDATTPGGRAEFLRQSPAKQQRTVERAHARVRAVARVVDAHVEPHVESARSHMARAVHPSTLALGLGAGVATQAVLDPLLPKQTPDAARVGIEGVATGIVAEAGAASLAGAAFGVAAAGAAGMAGGVAALGGYGADAATQAVAHSLGASDDVSEALGAGAGGAVAGGLGIGAAALMGAEVGAVAGPVGVGVGMLLGLGGFLVGKLVH